MKRKSDNEVGIAMVTVLFVGAALTALASVAAFTTVRELRASTDDRRSGRALAFSEAGVDRMISYLKSGKVTWNDIALAGCTDATTSPDGRAHPALRTPGGGAAQVGTGSYTARLEVFNPFATDPAKRFAPGACNDPAFPRYFKSPKTPSGSPQYFAIISTGASASSAAPCPAVAGGGCRVVRQVLAVRNVGLPVGVYASDGIDANGAPTMDGLSMVSPGPITGREKIGFVGTDKYYFLSDFGWDSMTDATTTFAPAGAHTLKSISLKSVTLANSFEHPSNEVGVPSSMSCKANDLRGTLGQSMWDQSGTGFGAAIPSGTPKCSSWGGSPTGPPPTSLITDLGRLAPTPEVTQEDYEGLKQTAEAEGLFCSITSSGHSCTRRGGAWNFNPASGIVSDADLTTAPSLPNVFVAYFDFAASTKNSTNLVKWGAKWNPCNLDPALNKTVILIVRNGSLFLSGETNIHGVVLVPEGTVSEAGGATIDGSVIARTVSLRGSSTFRITDCASQSLSSLFLDFTPFTWTEVDR